MERWDIEEMVARYNEELLEGEEPMTVAEMKEILSE